jgi:hypothetical protein
VSGQNTGVLVLCGVYSDYWAVKCYVKDVCTRGTAEPAAVNLFLIFVMTFSSFMIGTDEIMLK